MEQANVRLRWTSHQGTVMSMFDALYSTQSLVDVTLACEGKSIQAHKVVLSACSPYFQELLSMETNKYPIVFLKGVNYEELKAMVEFMYRGEVNISQAELQAFLSVAQSLRIRGLTDVEMEPHKLISPNVNPVIDVPAASNTGAHSEASTVPGLLAASLASRQSNNWNFPTISQGRETQNDKMMAGASKGSPRLPGLKPPSVIPSKRPRGVETRKESQVQVTPLFSQDRDPFAGIPVQITHPISPGPGRYEAAVSFKGGMVEEAEIFSADGEAPIKIESSDIPVIVKAEETYDSERTGEFQQEESWMDEEEDVEGAGDGYQRTDTAQQGSSRPQGENQSVQRAVQGRGTNASSSEIKRRKAYTIRFKYEAIKHLEVSRSPFQTANTFGITHSQVMKWAKQKFLITKLAMNDKYQNTKKVVINRYKST